MVDTASKQGKPSTREGTASTPAKHVKTATVLPDDESDLEVTGLQMPEHVGTPQGLPFHPDDGPTPKSNLLQRAEKHALEPNCPAKTRDLAKMPKP